MASLGDLFTVAKLTSQLLHRLKHAPIQYEQTTKTLQSLSRLLEEMISITKQFHELDTTLLAASQAVDLGTIGSQSIARKNRRDWIIDLDGPVGKDIHEHVEQCFLRLKQFNKDTTKWQNFDKYSPSNCKERAKPFDSFRQTRKLLSACFDFSARRMRVFEDAIQKHIDALRFHIFLASVRCQIRVEERVVEIQTQMEERGRSMFEKVEQLMQTTVGIATVPSAPWGLTQSVHVFEPYGILTDLHLSLCTSGFDLCRTLATALKTTSLGASLSQAEEAYRSGKNGNVWIGARESDPCKNKAQGTVMPGFAIQLRVWNLIASFTIERKWSSPERTRKVLEVYPRVTFIGIISQPVPQSLPATRLLATRSVTAHITKDMKIINVGLYLLRDYASKSQTLRKLACDQSNWHIYPPGYPHEDRAMFPFTLLEAQVFDQNDEEIGSYFLPPVLIADTNLDIGLEILAICKGIDRRGKGKLRTDIIQVEDPIRGVIRPSD
ncbi:hypothetical protein BJ508DRAFT_326227 [Ascobolus immersus RN42]|uniref:Uncharacterized protein n=1 Tax=Ascobolus immersus RN42 TaxID=1160509 RepID=A0A3N4I632_ASCIM|nr:hypothetical protein BJ508DRAFT_326227 [Ascobolus immersus RN42]